jgi:hypothetical protein
VRALEVLAVAAVVVLAGAVGAAYVVVGAVKARTRPRAQSGPCDTYLDRYEIRKLGSVWIVTDRVTGRRSVQSFKTMAKAKAYAETCVGGLA